MELEKRQSSEERRKLKTPWGDCAKISLAVPDSVNLSKYQNIHEETCLVLHL